MDVQTQELVAFRRTGEKLGSGLGDIADLSLCPALMAPFRDLSKLRHDYPLVLVESAGTDGIVRSLSSIVDQILQGIAPQGLAGERLRKSVLKLEAEMRRLVLDESSTVPRTLHELWDLAQSNVAPSANNGATQPRREDLSGARAALDIDGKVLGCNDATTAAVITHVWTAVQRDKTASFLDRIDRLVLKLSEILAADFMKSDEARSAAYLKGTVGTAYETTFDFGALSRILSDASPKSALPEARARRIRAALSTLESQKFFSAANARSTNASMPGAHDFVFDSCDGALSAFRARLPEMLELIKDVAIAELEIANRYNESKHDAFFDHLTPSDLSPSDWADFPSYLTCLQKGQGASNSGGLVEALASGLPMKVLVEGNDLLEEATPGSGRLSFGAPSTRLANMLLGLNGAFVLQSSLSHLYRMRRQVLKGLTFSGPAVLSVLSGSAHEGQTLPPYLVAAAAMQSRAVPAFTYDPTAGADWASRFSLADNPAVETDWPVGNFQYQDEDLQSVSAELAFTLIDFAAADGRYAAHFARIPHANQGQQVIPMKDYLEGDAQGNADAVPFILMVDKNDRLHRVAADDAVIDAARRCTEAWRGLQELGGINNSHAKQLLAKEKVIWEEQKARELEELKTQLSQATAAPPAEPSTAAPTTAVATENAEAAAEVAAAEEEPSSDEAYIETPRCTTCDECTDINNRMFVYDDNKQAFIADLSAGTYRELVEAAESCKVAIIHPGKPQNPDEPDLEELVARAEEF